MGKSRIHESNKGLTDLILLWKGKVSALQSAAFDLKTTSGQRFPARATPAAPLLDSSSLACTVINCLGFFYINDDTYILLVTLQDLNTNNRANSRFKRKMQQRKFGRPSGTDGSDFSYRMVVDSRYTKVAKGKSRLYGLILCQVCIHLVGLLCTVLSTSRGQEYDMFAISSSVIGLISLLIGELGRRRNRLNLLRVFILASSVPIFHSVYSAIRSNSPEVIWNLSDLGRNKFAAVEILLLVLGLLLQLFTIITTSSLVGNMSPPKKAS